MDFRALTASDFPAVHAAFLEAFCDYSVPFQPSTEELAEMLRRRLWVPEASVGVFDSNRLVAFTLNGVGSWDGAATGYDTGTGVVPSHRGGGLASAMIGEALSRLRENGAEQYLLEVLQSNERALHVYRDAGFEVVRGLQCWSLARTSAATPRIQVEKAADWSRIASFFDVRPSWQNSVDCVRHAAAPRRILTVRIDGTLAGCAVVFDSGDVPFLAVAQEARGRGLGRELLQAAAAERDVRLLNVDAAAGGIAAFLERCGARRTVAQWEMLRAL